MFYIFSPFVPLGMMMQKQGSLFSVYFYGTGTFYEEHLKEDIWSLKDDRKGM